MPALPPSYLRGIAALLVLYTEERGGDRGRVAIDGAGVGDSRLRSPGDARAARMSLITAMELRFCSALAMELRDARKLAERLVEVDASGTVRVCGSELVGAEDPLSAAHRARSVREVLVAELERALDQGPVTSRRGAAAGGK
ncbi:hypothetical protein [Sorangium sp. So ce388]|uniref:hypothetical protein n=1 Tax=Sorangium sp. So ce388 TaxID=3133309 RepID=UPI003F5B6160